MKQINNHPKIQILTIENLLHDKRIDYPVGALNITLKKSELKGLNTTQGDLFLDEE